MVIEDKSAVGNYYNCVQVGSYMGIVKVKTKCIPLVKHLDLQLEV